MTSTFSNVLSHEDIHYLNTLPEVLEAKAKLNTNNKVYFQISITDSIRDALLTNLGLDLTNIDKIPMRWIKGDTEPHVDVGSSTFDRSYLVYLNNNDGSFVVDNSEYPIVENTGFVFPEQIVHKTVNTGITPRLLIGPMNEMGMSVGGLGGGGNTTTKGTIYYNSQSDAISYFVNDNANSNIPPAIALDSTTNFIVGYLNSGSINGYTSWGIYYYDIDNSNASSAILASGPYQNGDDIRTVLGLNGNQYNFGLYPILNGNNLVCFAEGTKILCLDNDKEVYIPIENIRKGTLVKTLKHEYLPVDAIGKRTMHHHGNSDRIKDQLYKCTPKNYPELMEDLVITGCHCILVDKFKDEKQRDAVCNTLGKIYITDDKYRLPACVDERADVYDCKGEFTIYHLALENEKYFSNYAIYANGLLVETCSKRYLRELSGMTLIE